MIADSRDGSASQSVYHFGRNWNISTTIGWIAMKEVNNNWFSADFSISAIISQNVILCNTLIHDQIPAN